MKKLFSEIPHMTGDHITLRRLVPSDAAALRKNGFSLVAHAVPEDWGYETPMIVDKWIR